jgi:NAD(P)-dependent dehydrogenase (short-subunit alcohol dehydrogenase family)
VRIDARWFASNAGYTNPIAHLAAFAAQCSGLDVAINSAAISLIVSISDRDFAEVNKVKRSNYLEMFHPLRELPHPAITRQRTSYEGRELRKRQESQFRLD